MVNGPSRRQFLNVLRGAHPGGFGIHHLTVRTHHLHIGDADEAHHMAQPGGGEVDVAVHFGAARGDDKDGAFALEQAFGAVFGVAKGEARAGDQVKQALRLAGTPKL